MTDVDKITIPISKATFVTIAVVATVVNILTVYFTVQLQFQQQKNDLIIAMEQINHKIDMVVEKLNNKDEKLDTKIDGTRDDINDIKDQISDGIKPDEVKKKVK